MPPLKTATRCGFSASVTATQRTRAVNRETNGEGDRRRDAPPVRLSPAHALACLHGARLLVRCAEASASSVDRTRVSSRSGIRRPSEAIEMPPDCSETTMAMASVCSLTPRAARWRVPRRAAPAPARQRQRAGGGDDALVADDQRLVVQGRVGEEDALDQLGVERRRRCGCRVSM